MRRAVIAAGGPGTRLHPHSVERPKVLLEVGGKPLLQRQIELLRDAMKIRDVLVVLGYHGDRVRARLGDGSALGVDISYCVNPRADGGLGTILPLLAPRMDEPFVLLLGDELYLDSNHGDMTVPAGDWNAVCAMLATGDHDAIRQNYAIQRDGLRALALMEKPQDIHEDLLGCGTYLIHPRLFEGVQHVPLSPRSGRLELTDILDAAAKTPEGVFLHQLTGTYVNVNTEADLTRANRMLRRRRRDSASISVVIPAWNEIDSIGAVVEDFRAQAQEIVVMDNCSTDGTAQAASEAGARVLTRPLRGYGDALHQGLNEARGDILVLVEADGTFRAADLPALLDHLVDADMVLGSRTHSDFLHPGANMGGLLRWGNIGVARLLQGLWWSAHTPLTDVGCTYRALWRETWLAMEPRLSSWGPGFSPEMMIEGMRSPLSTVEIPVAYLPRRGGSSKHSASLLHSAGTGLKMLAVMARKRLGMPGAARQDG